MASRKSYFEGVGKLIKNTGFLYLLSFSSQIVNIALIPYETRVLGAEAYGIITLAVSMSSMVSILLDFGFILSATEKVVKIAGDRKKLSSLVCNVVLSKVWLLILGAICLCILLVLVEPFKSHRTLFVLFYIAYAINSFLPDFLYRGLEDMRAITVRTVMVRVFFSFPIFVFLKGPNDLWAIPLFLLVGNIAAVTFSYVDIAYRYKITFKSFYFEESFTLLKGSLSFFISRFASTFYQSMNSVILGLMYPGQSLVGQYGASEKFLSYAKVVSSPIADSLYPYMVRTRNYKLCIFILKISAFAIVVFGVFAWVFAEPLCAFIFGPGYSESAVLLRCLMPAIMVIFPTYLLCFPMLVPMNLADYANRSNVIGAIVQVSLLCILFGFSMLNARTLCVVVSISEISVFFYRLWAVWLHRNRLNEH